MTEPLIQVTGLTMGWDDVILQKDATFHVDRGEVFAILGGSGCGKSTLLRNLIGLETPMAGEISIAGLGHPNLDEGRPPFGVMFQGGALFGSLTVGENIGLPLEEWTKLPHEAIGAIVRFARWLDEHGRALWSSTISFSLSIACSGSPWSS